MLHKFLANNRTKLITRCAEKVAKRPLRSATAEQLQNGISMFIDQLTKTLAAEYRNEGGVSLAISGASGGDASALSEMGKSAAAHGKALLELGYSVDQVVHDYGDLCQAITDLAFERDAPFTINEFRTLNRCLDNAIADAVTEFSAQRDAVIAQQHGLHKNEQFGFLMHELRNALGTATLAVAAIDLGNLTWAGATGAVLKRSHAAMARLISRSLSEVKIKNAQPGQRELVSLAKLIADAQSGALLDATLRGCKLTVTRVDPLSGIDGNYDLLLAALMNLLHNAFKFTHPHTEVTLSAYALGGRVLIDPQCQNCCRVRFFEG